MSNDPGLQRDLRPIGASHQSWNRLDLPSDASVGEWT